MVDDDFDDEDEDDDIDAKFEQYKNEMRLKELAANSSSEHTKNKILEQNKQESVKDGKIILKKGWSWSDSLRSNSDKFLETLENDMDGERSLKRSTYNKNPIVRVTKG